MKKSKLNWANVKKNLTALKLFPVFLIVFGAFGLLASGAIAVEKEHLLKNPETELVCNLNPIYSCSNVFLSKQSQAFGVSNELLGIAIFAALITLGVTLFAGAKMKNWLWYTYLAGMLGFMAMVVWFFGQSVYVIGSLCIFCSCVWFSAWTLTTTGFAWIYDSGYLKVSKKYDRVLRFFRRNIISIWLVFLLTLVGLVLNHFWYYYGQYFGQ